VQHRRIKRIEADLRPGRGRKHRRNHEEVADLLSPVGLENDARDGFVEQTERLVRKGLLPADSSADNDREIVDRRRITELLVFEIAMESLLGRKGIERECGKTVREGNAQRLGLRCELEMPLNLVERLTDISNIGRLIGLHSAIYKDCVDVGRGSGVWFMAGDLPDSERGTDGTRGTSTAS
jgi:hypothetical protein